MRSDTLVFLHVLVAMVMLGTAATVTILLLGVARRSGDAARVAPLLRLAYQLNLWATIPASVITVGLGEGLKAKEDAEGAWLDVSSGLSYVAIVIGALVLHAFLRRGIAAIEAGSAPSASTVRGAASLSPAIVTAILVVAFLMTGKPS